LASGILSTNLGLSAAASWGAADFTGGIATRRATPFLVVAIAHGLSLIVLLGIVFLLHTPAPTWTNLSLGFCAGITGGIGLVTFYQALTYGPMGLTASLAGLLTAIVPVLFAFFREGLPKPVQLAGFAIAIPSIWLVASAHGGKANGKALWLGAIAGVSFGFLLALLRLAGQDGAVLWPLTSARVASTSIAVTLLLLKRKPIFEGRGFGWLSATTGLLDTGGNFLYCFAAKAGRMDVAAVLSSLYPAVTILLAVIILKERATRTQIFGMILALMAVALISA
jgi:drug/metabolite transporter (DMT)-like permease